MRPGPVERGTQDTRIRGFAWAHCSALPRLFLDAAPGGDFLDFDYCGQSLQHSSIMRLWAAALLTSGGNLSAQGCVLFKDNPIVPEADGRRRCLAGPNYTPVPNEIIESRLRDLTAAELKVCHLEPHTVRSVGRRIDGSQQVRPARKG